MRAFSRVYLRPLLACYPLPGLWSWSQKFRRLNRSSALLHRVGTSKTTQRRFSTQLGSGEPNTPDTRSWFLRPMTRYPPNHPSAHRLAKSFHPLYRRRTHYSALALNDRHNCRCSRFLPLHYTRAPLVWFLNESQAMRGSSPHPNLHLQQTTIT